MLKTEERNPNSTHIDKMSTGEMLRVMQLENLNAARAVGEAMSGFIFQIYVRSSNRFRLPLL